MSLPSGTVTFMFSDIEGSTALAQRFGVDYSSLVGLHFDILRGKVIDAGGSEVRTIGDGFFAVFEDAAAAVGAAAAIQRAMNEAEWPESGEVRVRIGLHTGVAEPTGDDYQGIEVNRAARVGDAGHGGQVILTESTKGLLGSAFIMRELGRHDLKGLDVPESLYQLIVSGLPTEFPPLRTARVGQSNLPVRANSIVGREEDLQALSDLIELSRLVTLLGPGGVGKTSLAITAASSMTPKFPDGVTFVDLSMVSDPALAIPTIANELGVRDASVQGVTGRLKGRRELLVIDNFEQLVPAATQIGDVISAAETAKALVTSQVPLRVPGEQRYLVKPLEVNGSSASAGVQLFMERARAADPSFEADPAELRELIAKLDGLPLAIELAAARANLLTPAEMLERIGQGSLTQPAATMNRHRSLSGALEWSHGLLTSSDQVVFRRLGVFAAGMTLSSAELVATGASPDPFASIAELVDRSLLTRELGASGRLRMLDGIRRFARDKLEASDDRNEVIETYVGLFTEMAEEAYVGLQSDKGELWRARLDDEVDNVRDVLGLLFESGRRDGGLGILGGTWRFFHSRGRLGELDLWLSRFLALPPGDEVSPDAIKGVMAEGALRYWQERPEEALVAYEQAVDMALKSGDKALLADAKFGLASSFVFSDRPEDSVTPMEEARLLYEQLGDKGGLADVAAGNAFTKLAMQGLVGLGPDFDEAVRLYAEAGRSVNHTQSIYGQSAVAIAEKRFADAKRHAREAIRNGDRLNDTFLVVWGIEFVALIEVELGNLETGGLLVGAADAARERIGGGWGPANVGLQDARTRLEELVGAEREAELTAPGTHLGLREAMGIALEDGHL